MCSVLFADLVGFTPLSEARDPEEVRELLSQYFDTARTVIGRYGGVVEKFIGDAVMAVWGTPVAGEDDAERAVRAGLDLAAAVTVLGEQTGIPDLAARAGVVTGEVAVNLGATNQGMVAGDAVNTASRVQAAAAPGSVWVDEVTHRLAAPAIGFDDAGRHSLKGKAEPVQLWVATRVLSGVGGAQRVDGLEAPLLGRSAELRTVRELFHATVERRSPRMVLVSGPAGVGKSRLGWEFEKYIDGLADQIWWHRGRCLSYGDGVVFWALAEIVRQRLGIAEEDPTGVAAGKLATGLQQFVTDPDERTYVGLRLGRLLGVPVTDDPGTALSREELFAGWRLFFERLAATGPVVLLVEDAQYADAGLLEFLDHLVDWARGVPIFVLVFARPELEHAHPNWAGGRNRTTMTLDPLDPRSMDDLVDALVPGMPPGARGAINGQAQGIPLFAVETIRSLIDRDIVVPRDGVYRLVGDIGALSVPDSLHALLAARLDALDPELRALVADAAVVGTTFPAEALVAVSGLPESAVRRGLAELLRREVLEVSADKLSPQRGSYRFAQNLLRQVAYETLSRRDRKARHLAVAAHLRATFAGDGDEVIDAVARHYRDALEAVPDDPDADRIRAMAVDALRRGAERARRSGSPRGAATSYATAAELVEQSGATDAPGLAAELWEAAAEAERVAGDYLAAAGHADRASAGYTAVGQVRAAARAQTITGRALAGAGRSREAEQRLISALEVLRPDPDQDTVRALSSLAAHYAVGGGAGADRLSAEALVLGQDLDLGDAQLVLLFNTRGLALGVTNRPQEAIPHFEYAARLAERVGDGAEQGRALINLADLLLNIDPRAAAEAARTAWDHARRVGARVMLSIAVGNLVSALILAGDWDDAESAIAATIDTDGIDDDYIMLLRARLAGLRGDDGTAEQLSAASGLRTSEDAQDRATCAVTDMLIADARGDLTTALDRAMAVVQLGSTLSVRHEFFLWGWATAARAARSLGDDLTVQGLLGDLDAHPVGHLSPLMRLERDLARARRAGDAGNPGAATMFADAVGAAHRSGSPYHLAMGLLDQAEFELAHGAADGAAPQIAEARQIAERLRAAPLAARAERLGAAPLATGTDRPSRHESAPIGTVP